MYYKNFICHLISLLLIAHAIVAGATPLPDLGDPATVSFPLPKERALGQQFIQQMHQSTLMVNDYITDHYLNALGQRLVSASDAPTRHFYFFIVKSQHINAFAGPYGFIGVNSGLILKAETESELASVLAHEIAHVTQHHITRGFANAKSMSIPAFVALLAAVAIGSQNANAGAGALTATVAGAQQHILHFSRQFEREADQKGLEFLLKAKFDPNGMVHFFQRLLQEARYYYGQPIEYLNSHPLTEARIADLRNRITQLEKIGQKVYSNELNFQLIKARLRGLTNSNLQGVLSYFSPKNTTQLTIIEKAAAEYGSAFAYYKAHRIAKAQPIIDGLRQRFPENLLINIAHAQIDIAAGQPKKGLSIYREMREIYPENSALVQTYAESLFNLGYAKQARWLLLDYQRDYPQNKISFELLGRIQASAGYPLEAYLTKARGFAELGNIPAAIVQLQRAIEISGQDSRHSKIREQLLAKLKEYQAL